MDINTECFDANHEEININDTVIILRLDSKQFEAWYNKQPSAVIKIIKLVPHKEQVYVKGYNNPINMVSVLKAKDIN